MLWINFLHFYQPANTDGHIIKEATVKSYLRIIRALEEHPPVKFTFNISGCLLLRWEELYYSGLIKRIKALIAKGQIELTGTAAYHPLLPLVPQSEAIKQIKEHEDIVHFYLGQDVKMAGFFLPELAYNNKTAKIVKSLGYKWLLMDEIGFNGKLNQVDYKKIYKDENSQLDVVFRNRKLSKSYVPKTIQKILSASKADLAITATDAELYGLRHEDPTGEFEKLLKNSDLNTLTISEYINSTKQKRSIPIRSCSWETTEDEMQKRKPFILWYERENKIQQKLWELANLAYATLELHVKDNNYHWARWHLVRGLASCTFWWASAKDFRLFGPISWSPDEIERGSNELIRAIRALEDVTTRKNKMKAERLWIKIKQMVWERHWAYYWKK